MLDQATKRKIDAARQVLVGKAPDPKAQVEHIMTALIHKFMDDMDRESEELGGRAKFFAGSHAQCAMKEFKALNGRKRVIPDCVKDCVPVDQYRNRRASRCWIRPQNER